MNWTTKDSGRREQFNTGSKRDTQEGKMRWDLIPWEVFERVVGIYTRGAEKYEEDNWKKGQPMRRYFASTMRHLMQYALGRKDGEDHAAAAIWNIMAMMWTEENIPELNDLFRTTTRTDSGRNLEHPDATTSKTDDEPTKPGRNWEEGLSQ